MGLLYLTLHITLQYANYHVPVRKTAIEDLSHKNPTFLKYLNFVFTLHINLRYYTVASLNFRRMQASKKKKSAILADT